MSGTTDEWFTPTSLLLCLPRIRLDPCYHPDSDVIADQTISKHRGEDGLAPWPVVRGDGIIFVNPPYSDCATWAEKVQWEARRQEVPIVCLVPAKAGEAYWAKHVYNSVAWCGFFLRRLHFVSGDMTTEAKNTGTFGSALLCYSRDREAADAVWRCLRESAELWPLVRADFGEGKEEAETWQAPRKGSR